MEATLQHRNDDMLLFIALGDAAGAGIEFVKRKTFPELIETALRLDGYVQHPTHLDLNPGDTTDDTHRSRSNTHVLINTHQNLETITKRTFIEQYVRDYKDDPGVGWARGYGVFLSKVRSASDFEKRIKPDSEKNGGCMGAVVFGVIRDPLEVMRVARAQAETTHNTRIGIFAAQAVALMSHFFIWSERAATKQELARFLLAYLRPEIAQMVPYLLLPRTEPVIQPAVHTVHAVFDLITTKTTLAEVLRGAMNLGGDADTSAAIAMGIASARMTNDIPQIMFDQLAPRTKYGSAYLKTLGTTLMNAFN